MKVTEPQVGIYWVIGRRLIAFTMPATTAPCEGGFRNLPQGHAHVWPVVQALAPAVGESEYFAHPRGRVLRVEATESFRVLGPALLTACPRLAARIARRFGLTRSRYEIAADQHYDPPNHADFED